MANLVLGPILRYVDESSATVWVETDAPCEVSILGATCRTFCVEGRHYGLVELDGLEPGSTREYTVELDGRTVWPSPDSAMPPSVIRTLDRERGLRLAFGSCRVGVPHEPPYVLDGNANEQQHGIDALRTLGVQLAEAADPDALPDLLLMLGDQVYCDDLSPAMRAVTHSREDPNGCPDDILGDLEEYACAYQEAWGEPVIRWLLSTVPTAMIFDDHEIHAEWKISHAWEQVMLAEPWYRGHIAAGMAAYWLYQHLGNLSPSELRAADLLDRVRAAEDAGPLLRDHMAHADEQPGHSRWSYCRDLIGSRLVVIDSRAGRCLEPGDRKMVTDDEWEWIVDRASGEFDHLLLASSVPMFLSPGLHYGEALDEVAADGRWGSRAARLAEQARQKGVMDHWASFGRSFDRLVTLLKDVSTGRRGAPPASVVMLSGDVHHCYIAEVAFRRGSGGRSAIWQCVCSAYRKNLLRRERLVMQIANSRVGGAIMRAVAAAGGVRQRSDVAWRLVHRPRYHNQVATLELRGRAARVKVETTDGSHWREPKLRLAFEQTLTETAPAPSPQPAATAAA
jgi:hypothetical protein